MSAYNYAAAFIAYSNGSSFEDVAVSLGIPLETLKTEARQHGWKRLAERVSRPAAQLSTIDLSLDDIQKNRQKSLKEAAPLETLLDRTLEIFNRWWVELAEAEAAVAAARVDHEQNATAESQQALQTAEGRRDMLREAAAPSPKALAELAKAVATIQDIRYRAVGDMPNKTGDDKPDARRALTQIVVNMPGVISKPREQRAIEIQASKPE